MALTDHKLRFTIDADGKGARKELLEVDRLIGRVGSGLGAWAGPAAIGATAIAGIGVAGVTAGVALFNLTKNAAEFGSEIFDASKKTGLHAESLSAMKFAADQSGTSLESVTAGVAKFAKTVGAAADDSKKAAKFLEDFGLSPQEAISNLDGALDKVFKRILAAPPGIQRMTLAQKAFGKSGADLLPFLDSFDGDLSKLIKRAKELGVTIDDEAARAADEFGDQLDTLNAQLAGVGRTIGTELMPVFTEMARGISNFLSENKDEIRSWGNTTANILTGLVAYWNDLTAAAARYGPYVGGIAGASVGAGGKGLPPGSYLGGVGMLLASRGASERHPVLEEGRQLRADLGRGLSYKTTLPGDVDRAGAAKKKAALSGDSRTDKQVYQDFVKELRNLGETINSGFRTYAQQAALYAKLPKGQAARPGTSDHEFYKGLDLRADIPDELVERAARAAGVVLGKKLIHQGTGRHRHQPFSKGKAGGGGEDAAFATAQAEQEAALEFEREIRDGLRDMAAEMIADEEKASDERLNIRQKEADQAVKIIEGMVLSGEMTELESLRTLGTLKLDMLEDERRELEEQIPTEKNLQRLEELRLEIGTQRLENTNEELQYWQKITDEINKQNNALQKKNQRPGTLKTRQSGIGDGSFMDQLDAATGRVRSMDDVLGQLGNTATDVFMQMGQALGASVEAWVLLGDNADISMQKMLASTLAGVAAQSAVLAIFHLAMGIAALTPWGAAVYGPAPIHFKAAAIWGAIAVGTALAGRAVAGSSNQSAGGQGSSTSAGGSSSNNREQDLRPYSRQSEDAYISGRREKHTDALARAVEKLEKKIGGMSPGDVLVVGSRQKRGFIGKQTAEDMKTNPQIGTQILRRSGAA